jgi:hypothetical protein
MATNSFARFGPYLVVVPITTITFALASLPLKLGVPGIVGGAVIGFLWSLLVGSIAERLTRRKHRRPSLANAPLLLAIICLRTARRRGVHVRLRHECGHA